MLVALEKYNDAISNFPPRVYTVGICGTDGSLEENFRQLD
jgi:hypothetical protein